MTKLRGRSISGLHEMCNNLTAYFSIHSLEPITWEHQHIYIRPYTYLVIQVCCFSQLWILYGNEYTFIVNDQLNSARQS